MNEEHFAALRDAADPSPWQGQNARKWAQHFVTESTVLSALPHRALSRDELAAFCCNGGSRGEACFLSVMAWGGMDRRHGASAWAARDKGLLSAVSRLRAGRLDRAEAFQIFQSLRNSDHLPGLGIAYFTKLMFFLNPGSHSYILDQWTAKSINLLFGPTVHLALGQSPISSKPRKRDSVSDRNNADAYALFCHRVEEIAKRLDWDGEEAERRLFSQKRPSDQHWRAYVQRNWTPEKHNLTVTAPR
ncbi:MAG TPA: hypothetical protein VGG36_11085 [Rhizomicrobium sp.]|jgi:hypothetical protein